ncbi:2-succinyl-5-enolpyruvyl-6-hydroxy-3-cyclohexene-1-carboxylic-acid synthase [Nocardioides marmoribigeumensis]|uniref:2-succinyl-5-enolpyruvyl-6-hydroxy-3-cyclohexene-1-carboxylate synthase n=1 Tax=Nocardioides marmoribigeumensis TaxID=433649 RepID=A0ABU2BST2_9ACTN|nr:2-succinyl-5-enolpyruvyl-6-hydroxy-3-cyclohexene-1-carboxylic-acid synthase [Nocardioides marmoribigeumensis]MDR7361697.1 2-succinyl-5-enolpyruvyl-6-hydroxy-3-cyclohexene-1-carboxylate synthase [Nocardioides marmoribigeumensis]
MTPPPNAATAAARTVVDELVRCGARHLVLSPGSRSAPLAFAAYDAAAAGRVELHTRLDERTAGFLALGLARTSRRPVGVVTTSGTAVANLHPAVLEASHSGLPLVLLTADRPAHLRGTGANQTTWQPGMFGRAVLDEADVVPGSPGDREDEQVRAWRAHLFRLVEVATTGHGPVHLNLQLDGPLTPDAGDGWSTGIDAADPPATDDEPRPSPEPLDATVRTVVVAGDDAGPPARVLAEQAGWPLLAEPSSGSRTGDHAIRTGRLLLADPALAGGIDRVVVAGHPTLSRPVTRLVSRTDVEVVALADRHGRWTDPGHVVSRVIGAATVDGRCDKKWLADWKGRDAEVSRRLDELVDGWDADLVPHQVAREVATALPPGGLLFVGSSNPVRDLDLMVPRYDVGARRMVVANRGLAGIDGTLSSAIGCALGRPRSTRALALLGDVTFLHDLTGLAIGPVEARPDLTVVVVNDDGGSIFALLEQGAETHAASFERLFATPHGADLGALCAGLGVHHRQVRDPAGLRDALATPAGGLEVVEAVVRRDDRRALDAAIRALV